MVIYPTYLFWSMTRFFRIAEKKYFGQINQKKLKGFGALKQTISKIMLAIMKITS